MSSDSSGNSVTRRSFLKASGLAAAAGALGVPVGAAEGEVRANWRSQRGSVTAPDVFSGMALTDQYGRPFNPAETFGDKPYLIAFGYNDCAICGGSPGKVGIMDAVAAIQKKLRGQERNIPIVVISVDPASDREPKGMQAWLAAHRDKGIEEFAGAVADSDRSSRSAAERLLHLACPASPRDAQTIQERLRLPINLNNFRQHSDYVTLIEKNRAVGMCRLLPPHTVWQGGQATLARQKQYIENVAAEVAGALSGQGRAR